MAKRLDAGVVWIYTLLCFDRVMRLGGACAPGNVRVMSFSWP